MLFFPGFPLDGIRIGEKYLEWSDITPTLDELLTIITLYWLTDTFPSSIYTYRYVRPPITIVRTLTVVGVWQSRVPTAQQTGIPGQTARVHPVPQGAHQIARALGRDDR